MPSKPRVIVTRKLPDAVEAHLAAHLDAVLNPEDAPFSREGLAAALREADGLLPTVTDALDAAMIATPGRRVRIVANFAVGVNNIDLEAAKAAGLVVTNTPDVLTDATADLAIALILAATRRMSETEAILRRGGWDGFRPTGWLGMGLQGKTLGIVGMGRIGQATARRAEPRLRHAHHLLQPLAGRRPSTSPPRPAPRSTRCSPRPTSCRCTCPAAAATPGSSPPTGSRG